MLGDELVDEVEVEVEVVDCDQGVLLLLLEVLPEEEGDVGDY